MSSIATNYLGQSIKIKNNWARLGNSAISTFAYFPTTNTKNHFLQEIIGTRLCLHPNLVPF